MRLPALGRRALPVNCDVTSIEQIRAMFAQLDRGIRADRHTGQCGWDRVCWGAGRLSIWR